MGWEKVHFESWLTEPQSLWNAGMGIEKKLAWFEKTD